MCAVLGFQAIFLKREAMAVRSHIHTAKTSHTITKGKALRAPELWTTVPVPIWCTNCSAAVAGRDIVCFSFACAICTLSVSKHMCCHELQRRRVASLSAFGPGATEKEACLTFSVWASSTVKACRAADCKAVCTADLLMHLCSKGRAHGSTCEREEEDHPGKRMVRF